MTTTYGFWNNKGGTGKTSLCFQVACSYAHKFPEKRLLAIDVCPQANLSELFLGGLTQQGSANLLEQQDGTSRTTIGGYFEKRLPSPYAVPSFSATDYIVNPTKLNSSIPVNIDLVCGDPLIELQANAMSTLANAQIPGTDTWLAVIDWLRDFIDQLDGQYDAIFVDSNPSFSLYTQIALSSVDKLVLPVMADDSSRRAIQNAFSLIFGFKLPSEIYASFAFNNRLSQAGRKLPRVHVIAKNRLTQYMGPASAYAAVLKSIDEDIAGLMKTNPDVFSFSDLSDGIVEIRDFQTTGVVAFAHGAPFYAVKAGTANIMGRDIKVRTDYLDNCRVAIEDLSAKLE